jgi:hypothetical protein
MGDLRSCCAYAGVRRILAVTADKAEAAFKKVGALAAQEAPDEGAVKALVDRIDRDDSLPTTSRSEMKAQVRRHCSSVAYPHRKPHESY